MYNLRSFFPSSGKIEGLGSTMDGGFFAFVSFPACPWEPIPRSPEGEPKAGGPLVLPPANEAATDATEVLSKADL